MIYETPCAYSQTLSELAGVRCFVKLENLQMTGSFKERGAANLLLQLDQRERARGVATASAGNHGLAVAYHAERLGIAAVIVMPEWAPLIKVTSARRHRAEVILAKQGLTKGTVGERIAALFADTRHHYANTDVAKEQLIADLNKLVAEIRPRLPEMFGALPKADVEIRRVPKFIEAGAPGGYYNRPALDGSGFSIGSRLSVERGWVRLNLPKKVIALVEAPASVVFEADQVLRFESGFKALAGERVFARLRQLARLIGREPVMETA